MRASLSWSSVLVIPVLIGLHFFHACVYSTLIPPAVMDREGVASTSEKSLRDGSKTSRIGRSRTDCPIDKLSKQEFQAYIYIPNSISIQLSHRKASSTNGLLHNMIYFTKEQFATGLCLPIPFFSSSSSTFLKFHLLFSTLMSSEFWCMQCFGCIISIGYLPVGGRLHLHDQNEP